MSFLARIGRCGFLFAWLKTKMNPTINPCAPSTLEKCEAGFYLASARCEEHDPHKHHIFKNKTAEFVWHFPQLVCQ